MFALTVHRSPDTLPQTTTESLFTVSGGLVRIAGVYGRVTTAIQNQVNSSYVTFQPTVGDTVSLSGQTSLSNLAVDFLIGKPGVLGYAVRPYTADSNTEPFIVGAGNVRLQCEASNTGAIEWWLEYEPLEPGAKVVTA